MGRSWNDFLSVWDDLTAAAEEIIPAREGLYVVLVRPHGLGKESGVPIEGHGANVVTMREGKITRFELVWDRDAALEAAGLRSPG